MGFPGPAQSAQTSRVRPPNQNTSMYGSAGGSADKYTGELDPSKLAVIAPPSQPGNWRTAGGGTSAGGPGIPGGASGPAAPFQARAGVNTARPGVGPMKGRGFEDVKDEYGGDFEKFKGDRKAYRKRFQEGGDIYERQKAEDYAIYNANPQNEQDFAALLNSMGIYDEKENRRSRFRSLMADFRNEQVAGQNYQVDGSGRMLNVATSDKGADWEAIDPNLQGQLDRGFRGRLEDRLGINTMKGWIAQGRAGFDGRDPSTGLLYNDSQDGKTRTYFNDDGFIIDPQTGRATGHYMLGGSGNSPATPNPGGSATQPPAPGGYNPPTGPTGGPVGTPAGTAAFNPATGQVNAQPAAQRSGLSAPAPSAPTAPTASAAPQVAGRPMEQTPGGVGNTGEPSPYDTRQNPPRGGTSTAPTTGGSTAPTNTGGWTPPTMPGAPGSRVSYSHQGPSAQEQQFISLISDLARQLSGSSESLYNVGLPAYTSAIDFWQKLMNGDRAAMQGAVAPTAELLREQSQGLEGAITAGGQRGGGTEYGIDKVKQETAAAIAGLTVGQQKEAANQLMGGGLAGMSQASNTMGQAGSMYNGMLNYLGQDRQFGEQMALNADQFNANMDFNEWSKLGDWEQATAAMTLNKFLADRSFTEMVRQFDLNREFQVMDYKTQTDFRNKQWAQQQRQQAAQQRQAKGQGIAQLIMQGGMTAATMGLGTPGGYGR